MRGSKKGPHKCFKTLTERLTPKYVCPSKGKAGVTALSTMGTRPERAVELEAAGDVRKPPKQQRELEGDPIAQLERKEKAREQKYLARMRNHPQTMHADDEEEATYHTPDTIHHETDDEAEAQKVMLDKAFNTALDSVMNQMQSPFSSVYKSLGLITDLNDLIREEHLVKAQKGDPNDPKGAIKSQWTSKLPFATTVEDFKEKFQSEYDAPPDTHLINEFKADFKKITGFEPTPEAKEAHFKKLKSKMFTVGPPQEPTTEVVRHKGKTPIPDPMQTPARYGGSEKRIMIQPGEMYTKPIIKPLAGREKDILLTDKQVTGIKRQEGMQAQLGFGAVKRFDLTTEEGRRKKIEGMMLGLEGLAWLLPTTAGARIIGGGAKILAPSAIKAISTIGKTLSGAKLAAHSKTANALVALLIAASSPGAKGVRAMKTLEAASKVKNVAQVTKILEVGAQHSGKLKVAAQLSRTAPKVASAAPKVSRAAQTTAAVAEAAPTAASQLTGSQLAAAATVPAGYVAGTALHGRGTTERGGGTTESKKPSERSSSAKAGSAKKGGTVGASGKTSSKTPSPTPSPAPTPAPDILQQLQMQQQAQQDTSQQQQTQSDKEGKGRGRGRRARGGTGKGRKGPPPPTEAEEETAPIPPKKKLLAGDSPREAQQKAERERKRARQEAEKRAKQAAKASSRRREEDRYSTVRGEKKKFAQLRASLSSMDDYAHMYKSKSYLAPIVRQVEHKNISLKEALDLVPWHMQAELLKRLSQRA